MTRDTVRRLARRTAQGLVAVVLFGCGILPIGKTTSGGSGPDGGVVTGGSGQVALAVDSSATPATLGGASPLSGRSFLELAVALTNETAGHSVGLDPLFFHVTTDSGLDVQASGATVSAKNPCAADLSVAQGATARCHVVFEVPQGSKATKVSFDDTRGDTAWSSVPTAPAGNPSLNKNFMLLVDRSGSMNDLVAPPASTSKAQVLRAGMSSFVASVGSAVRLGLTFFPFVTSGDQCGASTAVAQALPAPSATDGPATFDANASAAQGVASQVSSVSPGGGTPTSLSLGFVGGLADFATPTDGRGGVIVLITDGLPNCNPSNPNSCANAGACKCTLSSCGAPGSQYCTLGCLDQDATVTQIRSLKSRGLLTAVVGIGLDTTGSAAATLSAMALEGGLACSGLTQCLNGTYHVSSAADLKAVLTAITAASTAP